MSMESHVYRFADLVLDVRNRRLTRLGVEVYLAPKTFDTLLVLVQRHGQLVTKGALLDAVWNDTAVTDNALTQQISELRELLGDDARRPRFTRTVPRVGFTFIAPIDSTPPGIDATSRLPHDRAPREPAEPPPHRPSSRQAGVSRPGIHALRWATAHIACRTCRTPARRLRLRKGRTLASRVRVAHTEAHTWAGDSAGRQFTLSRK